MPPWSRDRIQVDRSQPPFQMEPKRRRDRQFEFAHSTPHFGVGMFVTTPIECLRRALANAITIALGVLFNCVRILVRPTP